MDNPDPGGNKKNKKKKKPRGQETSGPEIQPYPGPQFLNGPQNGGFMAPGGQGGVGFERGSIGIRGAYLGKKPLLMAPPNRIQTAKSQVPEDFLQHSDIHISVTGGSRTVHQSMNPRQGAQGVGRGHQDPGQRGLEKQDSNPKSAGGKAKAKTDQKGAKQGKDAGQQKGGRAAAKDGGMGHSKAADSKTFKGKLRDEDYAIVLRELASHRIFELRKRNLSFPNAKYFCRLCEYHLDRVEDCERHMDESRHQRKKEASDSEGILRHIPDPTPEQIKAIDAVLEVIQQNGLTSEDLDARQDIVQRLQKRINMSTTAEKGGMTLRLYGSSLSGIGLKDSDVNIEVSGSIPGPKLLLEVYNILRNDGGPDFTEVQSDFQAKVPVVRLTDAKTGLKVVLAINAQSAILTSTLLHLYCLADPRVKPLAVVLRSWAKICHLDRQEEGTLPPFALGIMVVFFLLQTKPPVLCHLKKPKDEAKENEKPASQKEEVLDGDFLKEKAENWESQNKMTVGELWVRLLQFYCLKFDNTRYVVSIRQQHLLSRQEKRWHSKKLAIEDPFSPKKNLASSMANTLIFEYFQSSLRKAYNYFGLPRDADGSSLVCIDSLRQLASRRTDELLKENQEPEKAKDDSQASGDSSKRSASASKDALKKSESVSTEADEGSDDGEAVVIQPNKSISERLRGVSGSFSNESALEMTTSECDITSDSIVTLSTNAESEAESNVTTASFCKDESETDTDVDSVGVLGVVDSDAKDRSASGEMTSDQMPTDLNSKTDSEQNTVPITESQSSAESPSRSQVPESRTSGEAASSGAGSDSELVEFAHKYVLKIVENAVKQLQLLELVKQAEPPTGSTSQAVQSPDEILHAGGGDKNAQSTEREKVAEDGEQPLAVEESVESNSTACFYKFTEEIFTGGKGPAVICGYCEKEGHIKANCPDDKLPSVDPLPPMLPRHMVLLDKVVCKVMHDFAPTEPHVHTRNRVVKDLEDFVREVYPGACFSLFGSSCNGFGFFSSDLDICMTLKGKTLEDIDVTETIEAVATKLMRKRGLYNVVSIPTAKVPIVKFTDRNTKLEGDISLYNILAQRNTRLLYCYSQIDPRVRQLGYAVKVFAKICEIGDASRGSLSSYGYILMMIHYLQQAQPPVVPVLQELHRGPDRPEVIVEGCNTWFFDDIPNLHHVWPGFRKNNQSPGALWLGFLRYYLEVFDWKGWVVTIRQKDPLTKFEKLWNGQTIAVEDPFDLNHNLGGGLSRKMNNYIYKTFVNGRMHFGTPFERKLELFQRFRSPEEYFFNIALLSDGKPPNDRGCRMCGKIGHMVKDCPQRQKRKGNQQNQGKEKEKEGTDKKGKNQGDQAANQTPNNASKKEKTKGPSSGPAPGQDAQKHNNSQTPAGEKQKTPHKGKAAPVPVNVSTPQSAVTTTTTTTIAATATTTSSGSNSNVQPNRVPPGFRSTPPRTGPKTLPSSQPASTPPPSATSASRTSTRQSPTAGQPPTAGQHHHSPGASGSPSPAPKIAQQGMRPPGVPMNVQQLFNMVQQQGGNVASLASAQPQQHPQTPLNPIQGLLSPEQQVALMGGRGAAAGGGDAVGKVGGGGDPTKSSQQKAGSGAHMSESGFAGVPQPIPLMSLFQQSPHPQQQQEQAQRHHQPPQHRPQWQQQQHQQQQQQSPRQQTNFQQQQKQQHLNNLLQQQQMQQQQIQHLMQVLAEQQDSPPALAQQLFLLIQQQQVLQQQITAYMPPSAMPPAGSPSQGMSQHSVFHPLPATSSSSKGADTPLAQPVHGQIPVRGAPPGQSPLGSGRSAVSQIPIGGQMAGGRIPHSSGQAAAGHIPATSPTSHGQYGSISPNQSGIFGPSSAGPWVFGQRPVGGQPVSAPSPPMSLSSPVFVHPPFPLGPPLFQMAAPGGQGHQTAMSPSPEANSPGSQKGGM